MKKIDIHCHTTNRKLKDMLVEYANLDAIQLKMKKYEIEKTIVLATYFPHKTSGISNFRLFHWIKDNPDFMMFGSLDFEHYFYQGLNELDELAELRVIKGIKVYTCYQNIDLGSGNFKRVIHLAQKYDLPIMFHSGESYSCKRKYGKIAFANLVKPSHIGVVASEYPGVNFIISHMGKPFFNEIVRMVKRYDNVYTDMSGLIDSKSQENDIPKCVQEIESFLKNCGSKKLLFGTDFPVQTHEHSVFMIEEAMKDFSEEDKQDVYYNNAWRLLK